MGGSQSAPDRHPGNWLNSEKTGTSASPSSASTQHVFASETPVQFSQELIDSLQASSETNSTRAKTLDLHIAQRVAAELEKLHAQEKQRLLDIRTELSSQSSSQPSPDSSSSDSSSSSIADKLKASLPGSLSSSSAEDQKKAQSTQSVQKEIEALRKKLGERKKVTELPKEVERAREGVVTCLRVNDRRPLDCWREVEAFKREVAKMEEKFVGDVL